MEKDLWENLASLKDFFDELLKDLIYLVQTSL